MESTRYNTEFVLVFDGTCDSQCCGVYFLPIVVTNEEMSKLGDTLLDDFLERKDEMRVRVKETIHDDGEERTKEERMLKLHTEQEVLKTFQQNFSILKYLKTHPEKTVPPLWFTGGLRSSIQLLTAHRSQPAPQHSR